jgi:dihydroorotate dehydrogenase
MDYYRFAGPAVRLLSAEAAHDLTIALLRRGLVPSQPELALPALKSCLWGREFANPFGLAAGFDKNGEVIPAMLRQGFGFLEVGTVTPHPQAGNPKPRLFRLPDDGAVINRMGFNNQGVEALTRRLARYRDVAVRRGRGWGGIVGVNLGKMRDSLEPAADYAACARAVAPYADYVVINVSSPNTPGLRDLQRREALTRIIAATDEALHAGAPRPPPLLAKVAPDLGEQEKEEIVEVALTSGIAGLIVSNTTVSRPSGLVGRHARETGGLSGRPLFELSTRVLADLRRLGGDKLVLIGAGGVASGADAYAKIRAGASLVQLYTALIYEGTGLITRMCRELAVLLARDGFSSVAEAVGVGQR